MGFNCEKYLDDSRNLEEEYTIHSGEVKLVAKFDDVSNAKRAARDIKKANKEYNNAFEVKRDGKAVYVETVDIKKLEELMKNEDFDAYDAAEFFEVVAAICTYYYVTTIDQVGHTLITRN